MTEERLRVEQPFLGLGIDIDLRHSNLQYIAAKHVKALKFSERDLFERNEICR